ncbi:potassium channel family protein [Fredinandcohnia sp. 179-A 10B2 NHS]|uniref:potassium channel family protein n=1 Tax=Fredinandcohnia sp. 179-A 10B2 NHS TaxID=3235176 RepID=UPI00399F44D0
MNKKELYYETFMGILAITSVIGIWFNQPSWLLVDRFIWGIFVIDVSVRLFKSKKKWEYIKTHPFDIIAIIPLDSIFRFARFARLIRLFRLLAIFSRLPMGKILKTNNLDKVIVWTFLLIFIAAIPIKLLEPNIATYEDAIWWAIVTATTVGYGDISPETGFGRVIAIVLMLFGIGLIGMVTGSISTYFIRDKKVENTTVVFIKRELDRYEELSPEDIDTLVLLMKKLSGEKRQVNQKS